MKSLPFSKGRFRDAQDTLLNRLDALVAVPGRAFSWGHNCLEHLVDHPVVFRLHSLSPEQQILFVEHTLLWMELYLEWNG